MQLSEEFKPRLVTHSLIISKQDLEDYPCWFLDEAHSIPPWTPLFAWSWVHGNRYGDLWAAENIGLPRSRGTDWRELDGCAYMCPILVSEPEEIKIRETRFKKHLKLFIQDYDRIWSKVIQELTRSYNEFKAFDVDASPDYALYDHFDRVFNFNFRVWALHSWMMYSVYELYCFFEKLCQDYLGIDDSSDLWQILMRGYDNKLIEIDRRLWKLYERAMELGLGNTFIATDDSDVINALKQTENGNTWLQETRGFYDFIQEHGWRLPRIVEFNCKTWIEDPSPAISFIKHYINKGGAFELDNVRTKIIEQRRQAQKEVLSRFPDSEQSWISVLMKTAQKAGTFSEDHTYYFEQQSHSLMRRAALSCAKRMVHCGLMDEAEDFVYLIPDEIKKNLLSNKLRYQKLIQRRKNIYNEYSRRLSRPPLLGKLSINPVEAANYMRACGDKVMFKVSVGEPNKLHASIVDALQGNTASPGTVTGKVRLVLSEDDISEIQPGEILVGVTTFSSWTPMFPLLKGVVLDRGASLSHAAIVGREYNIPVIVQTKEATRLLKTGDSIKLDGATGAIWKL